MPWKDRTEDRRDPSVWAVTCVFVRAGHRRHPPDHADRAPVDIGLDLLVADLTAQRQAAGAILGLERSVRGIPPGEPAPSLNAVWLTGIDAG